MIQGIDTFVKYFKDNRNDYVVIGGLATAMVMNELGFLARATKDIDLVIIAKENEQFVKKLLSFVKIAGYKTQQRTNNTSNRNLFRFLDSDNKNYPEQIELFSIHNAQSDLITDHHIIPIKTPEYYDYLSAILLNTEYFNLLVQHTTDIDGLHVATPEILIPLKIHAYLNLSKAGNEDGKKHFTDIIRLIPMLSEESIVELKGLPKKDFEKFLPILEGYDKGSVQQIGKQARMGKIDKNDLIELVKSVYKIN